MPPHPSDSGPIRFGVYLSPGAAEVAVACRSLPGVEVVQLDGPDALQAALPGLHAMVLQNGSYHPAVAAAAAGSPRLRWIQSAATGVDAFARNGIPADVVLTNAADVWAPSVADHAMALLLGCLRDLPSCERDRQDGRWDRASHLTRLGGLTGRRVLVAGWGAIGQAIGRRLHGFDAQVIALTRRPERVAPAPHLHRVAALDQLLPCLADVDAVILALPLTPETRHLVGADAIAALQTNAVLVNIGRGELVDEAALVAAMRRGHLRGVGLDVAAQEPLPPESPLWSLERAIISPHIAGFDDGRSLARLAALCRQNLERFCRGDELLSLVQPPGHDMG